nr:alpha/beta hydrolase [Evansella tamaricis]
MIHGNMTSSQHWDLVFEEMDEKYHLIAPDVRGFGESSYINPINSFDDLADDFAEFYEKIELQSAHVVAWSTGGGVGMNLAVKYPEKIESLTLLCSLSTRGYPFFLLDEKGQPIKRIETREELKQDSWRTIPIEKAYREKDWDMLKGIWKQVVYTNKEPEETRYDVYLNEMCKQRNLVDIYYINDRFNISLQNGGTGEVETITAPVLILEGEQDKLVFPAMTSEIREDFGGRASYHLLKGCGHSPLVDDLDQLIEVVTLFVEKHS